MMFAVVEVDRADGYIKQMKFVERFTSRYEAERFIDQCWRDDDDAYRARVLYALNYLKSIDIPFESSSEEWWDFLEGFDVKDESLYDYRSRFKKTILPVLIHADSLPRGDYHPPARVPSGDYYWVEIPE
jgi:hypothetical protein